MGKKYTLNAKAKCAGLGNSNNFLRLKKRDQKQVSILSFKYLKQQQQQNTRGM